MALTFVVSLQGYNGLCWGLGGGRVYGLYASDFIPKLASSLHYFSMTLCNSAIVIVGFLASLEEQGLGRRLFTTVRITTSSVMFGV